MMAKSLVRNRHAVTKMYGLKSQLQAVSLRIAVRSPTLAQIGSCMLGLLPGTHIRSLNIHPPGLLWACSWYLNRLTLQQPFMCCIVHGCMLKFIMN